MFPVIGDIAPHRGGTYPQGARDIRDGKTWPFRGRDFGLDKVFSGWMPLMELFDYIHYAKFGSRISVRLIKRINYI